MGLTIGTVKAIGTFFGVGAVMLMTFAVLLFLFGFYLWLAFLTGLLAACLLFLAFVFLACEFYERKRIRTEGKK